MLAGLYRAGLKPLPLKLWWVLLQDRRAADKARVDDWGLREHNPDVLMSTHVRTIMYSEKELAQDKRLFVARKRIHT